LGLAESEKGGGGGKSDPGQKPHLMSTFRGGDKCNKEKLPTTGGLWVKRGRRDLKGDTLKRSFSGRFKQSEKGKKEKQMK